MTAFSATPGTPIAITVQAVTSPDGVRRVLLQLPDGFVLLTPDDAAHVAARLLEAQEEIRQEPQP